MEAELSRLRKAFLLGLPLALVALASGGWLIGARALRPLQTIADTAERVTARGLDQRITLARTPDREVARVVRVLNQMMDRLQRSFQQANRFTADASHELKTPLAIMQGEVENALQLAPNSSTAPVLNNLLEQIQRLKSITRNLLLLAQADAGELKLVKEPLNLSNELEAALEDARVLAGEQELGFEVRTADDLCVQGDRVLLRTALLNLLGNAVKYNDPRGGRIVVEMTTNGTHVLLRIGNTGPGIPSEDRARLFQRFYRPTTSARERSDGNGLGLSLAREIIRAHGGELELEESRNGWTRFALRLPCTSSPPPSREKAAGERAAIAV